MKLSTSLFICLVAAIPALAQQTHLKVEQNAVKVVNAELVLGNATSGVNGYLYNSGNGNTIFTDAMHTRLNLGLENVRLITTWAAVTINSSDRFVLSSANGSSQGAITYTLPAANTVNPGHVITVGDASGTPGGGILVAPAGSDKINGASSATTPFIQPYFQARFVSDGSNNWYYTSGGAGGSYLQNTANLADVQSIDSARVHLNTEGFIYLGSYVNSYQIKPTDRAVFATGIISGVKTYYTLPSANSVNKGYRIVVGDAGSDISSVNGIIINAYPGDSVDGALSTPEFKTKYFQVEFVSDGVHNWQYDQNILPYTGATQDFVTTHRIRSSTSIFSDFEVETPTIYVGYPLNVIYSSLNHDGITAYSNFILGSINNVPRGFTYNYSTGDITYGSVQRYSHANYANTDSGWYYTIVGGVGLLRKLPSVGSVGNADSLGHQPASYYAVSSAVPIASNPSGVIGLTAINGSAFTYMRSDATPALDQSIQPLWTNAHTFSNYVNLLKNARFTHYNTTDTNTNYEKVMGLWQSNVYTLGTYYGGSGTTGRSFRIGIATVAGATSLSSGDRSININLVTTSTAGIYDFAPSTSGTGSIMTIQGQGLASSNTQSWVSIQPTISQSGTAGYTGLLISPFESTLGTGSRLLINAGRSSAASGGGTYTPAFQVSATGKAAVGGTASASVLSLYGNGSVIPAWGTNGSQLNIQAGTFTDNSTAAGATVSGITAINSFGTPTISATNATAGSPVTYTIAANLYIAGAPAAGSNVSIANAHALYVASGQSSFNGTVSVTSGTLGTTTGSANANFIAQGGTGTNNATDSKVLFGGASTVGWRAILNGNTSSVQSAGVSYANLVIGSSPITTATSGSHAVIANQVINPVGTVTVQGTATVGETSTLYVNGAATAGTNNYALHVAGSSAVSKIDGAVTVNNGITVSGGTTKLSTGMIMNRTPVSDANYSILTTDYIIAYTALTGARSVTLPSTGIAAGQEFIIKDESGSAVTNNITVIGTIDGGANKILNTAYGTIRLYYNGSAWFTY